VQFVDSLPVGLENVRWQIVAPEGGVKSRLEKLVRGDELFIDLAIIRDEKESEYHALIRVMPDLLAGITPDDSRDLVYHLLNAHAFFIDLDGIVTDNLVKLRIVINTEVTQPDLSAGYVVMWPDTFDGIANAS